MLGERIVIECSTASTDILPALVEGNFVLAAQDGFRAEEKLCLRKCGPCRLFISFSALVFQVEYFWNSQVNEVNALPLRLYHDASLDKDTVLKHEVKSQTGTEVQCVTPWVDTDNRISYRFVGDVLWVVTYFGDAGINSWRCSAFIAEVAMLPEHSDVAGWKTTSSATPL